MEEPRSIEEERRRALPAVLAVVAVVLAVLLVVFAVVQVRSFMQGVSDQARGRTVDRSGPVLLQSVRDLSRYEAATGSFQVIVDLQTEAGFLPSAIAGQRTLFVAIGSVDAFVDFARLSDDAVSISQDRTAVTVHLPHAALERPNLDHQRSYVYAEERGIVDRVRAFFDQSPNDQAQLYQLAEHKIAEAAEQSQLKDRAELNTRTMLTEMLRSLGYARVTVTFGAA